MTNLPSILSTKPPVVIPSLATSVVSLTAHKVLKLAVNARSGDTPHHGWSRPAGRPWTAWISQIVRYIGLTAADAWTVADDRSAWRALRPTAGYARQ